MDLAFDRDLAASETQDSSAGAEPASADEDRASMHRADIAAERRIIGRFSRRGQGATGGGRTWRHRAALDGLSRLGADAPGISAQRAARRRSSSADNARTSACARASGSSASPDAAAACPAPARPAVAQARLHAFVGVVDVHIEHQLVAAMPGGEPFHGTAVLVQALAFQHQQRAAGLGVEQTGLDPVGRHGADAVAAAAAAGRSAVAARRAATRSPTARALSPGSRAAGSQVRT